MEERLAALEKQLRLWKLLTLLCLILWLVIPLGWASFEGGRLESQRFILMDKHDHHRAVLSTSEDGAPSLVLYDKDGKIVALLSEKPDGKAEFGLYDSDGTVVFKAPAPAAGQ